MSGTYKLLECIYKGSQMGINAIDNIIHSIKGDQSILGELKAQLTEYRIINNKAKTMLHEYGEKEKDINPMAKISSDISTTVNAIIDSSSSHIAEMMMQGSAMGIIKIIKAINEYSDADEKAKDLANKLLDTEQSNFEKMKKFL